MTNEWSGDLIHDGAPSERDMAIRLIAFLEKQTDPRWAYWRIMQIEEQKRRLQWLT